MKHAASKAISAQHHLKKILLGMSSLVFIALIIQLLRE
jgi:hypothetical protein